MRDGRLELNCAVHHDRYQRTPDGSKFSERVYGPTQRRAPARQLFGNDAELLQEPERVPDLPRLGDLARRMRWIVMASTLIDFAAARAGEERVYVRSHGDNPPSR
jgi:hypothetical protein